MPNVLSKESFFWTVSRAFLAASDAVALAVASSVSALDTVIDVILDILEYLAKPVWKILANTKVAETFSDRPLSTTLPLIFVMNILTLTFIAFLEITSPQLGLNWSSPSTAVFTGSFSLSLWSYYTTVTTDPGRVPVDYHPDQVYGNFSAEEKKLKRLTRFCKREAVFKPDRAHFCTPLNRNVLKLDHYCAFTGNAVGSRNYRTFLQFLVFSNVGNAVALWKGGQTALSGWQSLSIGKMFLLSQSLVLGGVLSLVLVPFLGFHLYLTSINATTIEFCEGKASEDNPYNIGFARNWHEVFGVNPVFWVLPLQRSQEPVGIQFARSDYFASESDDERSEQPLLPALCDDEPSWKAAIVSAGEDLNDIAAEIYRGFTRMIFSS